jgi:TorA maturation chaperone TorD
MIRQETITQEEWLIQAALCELLAKSLQLPTRELTEVLTTGEYADTLVDIGMAARLDRSVLIQASSLLTGYIGQDSEELFHILRTEYTRLFVGAPEPVVSPFAGVWYAREQGVEPLLFVSTRAMEIERFLRGYGVGQAEGKNEPLDHIATEFEFLQYLALVNAGAVQAPEGIEIPADAFATFFSKYVANWVGDFAQSIATATALPVYKVVAEVIGTIMEIRKSGC